MEEDDANLHQEGGGAAGVRIFFNCVESRSDLRIIDLGGHLPHGKGPGGGFRTRWQVGGCGGSRGGKRMGSGRTSRRQRKERRRGS